MKFKRYFKQAQYSPVLLFSVKKIPVLLNKYFKWNKSKENSLIIKIILAYVIGCILTYFYGFIIEVS